MCCLYGILDYKRKLSSDQKNHLLHKLSIACEQRGTDATGIAYNKNGHMEIHKRPLPAHKFHQKIPCGVNAVMGHTRLTTQGNEQINHNNHPFRGQCRNTFFSLAHNGILYYETELREKFKLPHTNIETDSYVAVQMIEKEGVFDVAAIQKMAENIEGSFCFTLLDGKDNLYLVKGDNPLTVYHFEQLGFYIYASTEEILRMGLKKAGFLRYSHTELEMEMGDILILQADGQIEHKTFDTAKLIAFESIWLGGGYGRSRLYGSLSGGSSLRPKSLPRGNAPTYLDCIIEYAENIGITADEILFLYENGFEEREIEELLYAPDDLREYVAELAELL